MLVFVTASGSFVTALTAPSALADTIITTRAYTGSGPDDQQVFDPCPPGNTCVVVPSTTPAAPTILQSQSSDNNGSSAEAHINEVTGSLGVQATGYAYANASFNNEFFCSATSPCVSVPVPTGGVPVLLHFSLDGTITPPALFDSSTVSYGGYLDVNFQYNEHDIGGGYNSFNFDVNYDDTLDSAPIATVDFNGTQYDATLAYDTQADGSVKVSVDWSQPTTICPYGCNWLGATYTTGLTDTSIFGTYSSGTIDSEASYDTNGQPVPAGANFGATFITTITSLDPNYSFFSNNGAVIAPSTSVPEPESWLMVTIGLVGLAVMRRIGSRYRATA